jgi:hypothetical protein
MHLSQLKVLYFLLSVENNEQRVFSFPIAHFSGLNRRVKIKKNLRAKGYENK